jgi:hypothetical protein
MAKEQPPRLKAVLYAYRVVLTGIHLLRTGEVEANLPRLAEFYEMPFLVKLIEQKTRERAVATRFDWDWHSGRLAALEVELERAFRESRLPEERDRKPVSDFLVAVRMGAGNRS